MSFIPTVIVTMHGDVIRSVNVPSSTPQWTVLTNVALDEMNSFRKTGHDAELHIITDRHIEVRVSNQYGHCWTVHVTLTLDVMHPSSLSSSDTDT